MEGVRGFTLIELMVVIAIIGILAAFALPAYSNYTKRTYVAEGLQMSAGLKSSVTTYHASRNKWPEDNYAAGLSNDISKTDIVTSINVDGDKGVIKIVYGSRIGAGLSIILTPAEPKSVANNNFTYLWNCKSGSSLMDRYIPAACDVYTP